MDDITPEQRARILQNLHRDNDDWVKAQEEINKACYWFAEWLDLITADDFKEEA